MSKTSDIADEILSRIRSNAYVDKIPGERELADEFEVNVKTANRAVSQLVKQGILYRKRGEGTFITPVSDRRDLCIGLCFYKHTHPGQDPVFTRFFAGINAACKKHGLSLDVTALKDVIGNTKPSKRNELQAFRDVVLAANPDGILYLGNISSTLIRSLNNERPTVVLGHCAPTANFDYVRRNIRGAVVDAVKQFAEQGHQRIAFATYKQSKEDHDLNEKKQGYTQAMLDLGLETEICIGQNVLLTRLKTKRNRPSAIICSESSLGLCIMRNATSCNIEIPDDLAVISFDDGDIGEYMLPTMSSIHAFGEDLADIAIEQLLERLDGRKKQAIQIELPCPVIERESSS